MAETAHTAGRAAGGEADVRHRWVRWTAGGVALVASVALATPLIPVAPARGASPGATWATAARPAQVVQTAAQLADGRVLAGSLGGGATADCPDPNAQRNRGAFCFELYDPVRDRWRPTSYPTAALGKATYHGPIVPLLGGDALVLFRAQGALSTTKLRYSQSTDRWTEVRSEYHRASGFTATLLDPPFCRQAPAPGNYPCGQVLIAGGINDSNDHNANDSALPRTAELYDPSDGSLRATDTLPSTDRMVLAHATVLDDGRVMVAGGIPSNGEKAYFFDPSTGKWSRAENLPPGLGQQPFIVDGAAAPFSVRLRDGRVLLTGDALNRQPVLFDPASGPVDPATGKPIGRWSAVPHCEGSTRCGPVALLPDGAVLAAGGPASSGTGPVAASVLDPTTLQWGKIADLPAFRTGGRRSAYFTSLVLNGTTSQCGDNCGKVLAAGGRLGEDLGPGRVSEAEGTAVIYPGPVVGATGLLPNTGASCGGREVTITGSGFENANFVNFGDVSVARSEFAVNGDGTAITVKSPRHGAGEVPVTVTAGVTTPATSAPIFTFTSPGPATTGSLSARAGPASGGTPVEIAGSFAAECVRSVSFGDTPATFTAGPAPAAGQPAIIAATSPAHDPGQVRVRVDVDPGPPVPAGTVVPSVPVPPGADLFTYHPVISGLFPPSGPTAGGNVVTIAGKGLATASTVRFGADEGRITRRSDTEVVAVAPPHAVPETVVVQVVAAGIDSLPANVVYTYVAPEAAVPDPPGNEPVGPPKQDGTPPEVAPPGGTGAPSPSPSPGSAPSPANAPSPSPAQAASPAPAPVPGQAPGLAAGQAPTPGQAPAPGQAPSQAGSPSAVPPIAPVAGAAPAPAQAAPGSGQAAPGNESEEQVRGSTRHAMVDAQVGLGLAGAGAAACFSWMALTGRVPSRRRRPAGAIRPSRIY